MDQVSRPMQILLLAVVAFGALWFFALRPKGDSGGGGGSAAPAKPAASAPPTATSPAHGPGSSLPGGLGRAVQKARGAAGQSDATNQRLQQASGGATAANATPAAPANASAVAARAAAARAAAAPVGQVSRFASSIRGVQVLQSPTVVVVDRSHQARTLVGYTDRAEIGQAVDDALVGR